MMAPSYDVECVNNLIKSTIDHIDCYRDAARIVSDKQWQAHYFDRANDRERVVDELQSHLMSIGAIPVDEGSMLDGARCALIQADSPSPDKDYTYIAGEIERGNRELLTQFTQAAADADLSPETADAIERGLDILNIAKAELGVAEASQAQGKRNLREQD